MISDSDRAKNIRKRMGKSDALVHATQCLAMSDNIFEGYWRSVIELIKHDGRRHDSV